MKETNFEVKPCPFCGGEDIRYEEDDLIAIYCYECDCQSRKCETIEEAIEAWNRREPIDKIVEQLEKYKELECDDIDDDTDEEVEDAEELYDIGRSQGRLEAYLNAIEIIKGGAV